MQLPDTESAASELFGTETMAELCARQGRLAEAIQIFQRLLENNPPADKATRWKERCRSLERARAHAPDLILPEPTQAPARREARGRPLAKTTLAPAGPATDERGGSDFDLGSDVTRVTSLETAAAARTMDVTTVRSLESLARRTAVDGDYADLANAGTGKTPVPTATGPSPSTAAADEVTTPTPAATPAPNGDVTADPIESPHRLPLIITQPVRSGQVVYAAKNDLIVLGSVNSGGQVVADGNIHIYGALRGRAIAGAQGAADARIFCQKLEAELLAISGIYLIWDDIPQAHVGKPAQVLLQGDACHVTNL